MKKLLTICLAAAIVFAATGQVQAADVAGWEAFVIRNSTTGNTAPVISDDGSGSKLFQIILGGQKAGWATNNMNGKKVGAIQSLSIIRDSSVTGYGPYVNIWITDGLGGYAVLANEPSHTGEWAGSSAYDTTWDILKDATTWVYEVDSVQGFKLPNGTTTHTNIPAGTVTPHFTFSDFADYTVATPPSHWGGTGAPDVLNAVPYTAYGFNWVFGDTQSNYLAGYLVSNPTIVPAPVHNVTQGTYHATIQDAIDAANPGDTIVITADHSEGQVVIDRDIVIQGGSVHTITASADTGNSGDARAWFLVNPDVEVNVSDLIFDGNGHLIYQAFRHRGNGSFTNCTFRDIKYNESGPDYAGLTIVAFGGTDNPVDVTDCTFEDIGRVGVLYFGTGCSGSVFSGNTYTGKGGGDWLDYALDISAGAVVGVCNNTITNCMGVADSDGSTSAGVMVTTLYGAGTESTLYGNTITGNTTGIAAGYDSSDTSVVTANYNDLSDNDSEAIDNTSTTNMVAAEKNWWGTAVEGDVALMVVGDVDYSPILLTNQINMAAGAARLVELQNNDGGWDWPLDDGNPGNASPLNTVGPIAKGLIQAYKATRDESLLPAIEKAGDLLLSKTNNFSPSDGYLAAALDQVFGGTTYVDHVTTNFYGPLAGGTYNYKGLGTTYTTTTYVSKIGIDRANQGIANLAAWDIGMGLVGAASCGISSLDIDAWIAGVKAEINELDGSADYDVIGLAGGIYGLAFANEAFDPTAGEHEAASSLSELADILVSYQLSTGGFTWNSKYVIEDDDNETIQETAYAVLALQEIGDYTSEVEAAVNYLKSVQLCTGGWKNYTGAGENNEVTAEALWGLGPWNLLEINVAAPSLYVQPGENVITDMDVANLLQKVNSCQAILGYDSTYLQASTGCVVPGGSPWDDLIYNSWDIPGAVPGEIDTAIGIDAGSGDPTVGTNADNTVAVITLGALTEGITEIVFRDDVSDTECTWLADMSDNEVWPTKIDSQTIVIDGTDPTRDDITPADDSCIGGTVVLVFDFADANPLDNLELDIFGPFVPTPDSGRLQVTLPARDLTTEEAAEAAAMGATVVYSATDQKWTVTIDTTNALWPDGQYHWYIEVEDMAGNKWGDMMNPGAHPEMKYDWAIDNTAPVISNIVAEQGTGNSVLCAGGVNALQGFVDIYVDVVDDGCAALVVPPEVLVDGITSVNYIGVSGDTFHYQVEVVAGTTNGSHTITVNAADALGNSSSDSGSAICVNKNEITGQVELEGFVGASRAVTFVSTGTGVSETWTLTLTGFADHKANFTLTDVPDASTDLSAKTEWNLRSKVALGAGGDNQWSADLTGSDNLRGGDLNATNSINILDYSVLKRNWMTYNAVADINGDGQVSLSDFTLLKTNFFQRGDDL